MRRGSAVAFAALALLGLLGADAPRSAPPAHLLRVSPGLISSTVPATPVTPVAPVTIEPTLPLLINLKLTGQHGGAQGGVARLEGSLHAGAPRDCFCCSDRSGSDRRWRITMSADDSCMSIVSSIRRGSPASSRSCRYVSPTCRSSKGRRSSVRA